LAMTLAAAYAGGSGDCEHTHRQRYTALKQTTGQCAAHRQQHTRLQTALYSTETDHRPARCTQTAARMATQYRPAGSTRTAARQASTQASAQHTDSSAHGSTEQTSALHTDSSAHGNTEQRADKRTKRHATSTEAGSGTHPEHAGGVTHRTRRTDTQPQTNSTHASLQHQQQLQEPVKCGGMYNPCTHRTGTPHQHQQYRQQSQQYHTAHFHSTTTRTHPASPREPHPWWLGGDHSQRAHRHSAAKLESNASSAESYRDEGPAGSGPQQT